MRRVSLARYCAGLMVLLLALASPAWSAPATPLSNLAAAEAPALDENASIEQLSDRLDQVRQGVTSDANDDLLSQLRLAAMQVQRQADALSAQRTTDVEKLDDKLKVIGPVQPDEAATLTQQRKALEAEKKALVAQQDQATKLTQSARDLSTQIVNLRRSQFNSQITSRAASPLSPAFWQSIIRPTQDDVARLRDLRGEAADTISSAFSADNRWLFITSLVAAILVWTLVRGLFERLLANAMVGWLPEGRLRRSALALGVSLATLGTIAGSVSLLRWGLESSAEPGQRYRQPDQPHSRPGGVQCLHHWPGPRHVDAAASVLAAAADPRRSGQRAGLVPQGAGIGTDGHDDHGADEQRDRRQPGADGGRQRADRAGGGVHLCRRVAALPPHPAQA